MRAVTQSTVAKRTSIKCATYTLAEFAALLGISYTQAHESAMAGTLPVAPIRQGRKYLFPKGAVHRLLCMECETPARIDSDQRVS